MKKFFLISIIKTIYFNLKYFGFKGFKMPVLIGRNVKLLKCKGKVKLSSFKTGLVKIGFYTTPLFFKNQRCLFSNEGLISFSGQNTLSMGTKINVNHSGVLSFGENVFINNNSTISCSKNISIGNNCIISWDVTILDNDFHSVNSHPTSMDITIGDNVWIGMKSTLLKGTFISNDSVVASNSVVSKKFMESNIVIGNVNKIIKTHIEWKK